MKESYKVKKQITGEILVEVHNQQQAPKLLKQTRTANLDIKVTPLHSMMMMMVGVFWREVSCGKERQTNPPQHEQLAGRDLGAISCKRDRGRSSEGLEVKV